MFQEFPYTNFHQLNLDWIVKIAKDFLDQYTHIQEVIQTGLDDLAESRETGLSELDQKRLDSLAELNQKTLDGLSDLQQKYDTLDGLLQAWYDTHSADIADQLTDAIADFNAAAEAKSQALLDSWPADYSELVTEYNNLKDALTNGVSDLVINLFNPATAVSGKYAYGSVGSEYTETINSAFTYNIVPIVAGKKYICTGLDFSASTIDNNGIVKRILNSGAQSVSNYQFTAESGETKVIVNYRHEDRPTATYMLIEGDTLPESYREYNKLTLSDPIKNAIDSIIQTDLVGIESDISDLEELGDYLTNNMPGKVSENLLNPADIQIGKYISGADGSALSDAYHNNSSYACFVLDNITPGKYIVSGTNYNYFVINSSNNISWHGGNTNDNTNYAIEILSENDKKLAISFRPEAHPVETYMVVKGETMPARYEPYAQYVFNDDAIRAIDSEIEKGGLIFYVGRGATSDADYNDPITCFNAIKNITGKKTVHIYENDEGYYDLYDLLGGDDYFESIDPSTQTAYDVQPWLDNIEIIGHGKVVMRLYITADVPQSVRWLFSTLNIRGNCYIENITLEANSCRYCIHDESSISYPNTKHVYKNVKCKYLGTSQAVGCGYSIGSTVEIEDCIFESTNLHAYSLHTRGYLNLVAKNSIFIGGNSDPDYSPIRISQETDHIIKAKFENCFIQKTGSYEINLRPEAQYSDSPVNYTNIIVLNSNISSIDNAYSTNAEESVKYDISTGQTTVLISVTP